MSGSVSATASGHEMKGIHGRIDYAGFTASGVYKSGACPKSGVFAWPVEAARVLGTTCRATNDHVT